MSHAHRILWSFRYKLDEATTTDGCLEMAWHVLTDRRLGERTPGESTFELSGDSIFGHPRQPNSPFVRLTQIMTRQNKHYLVAHALWCTNARSWPQVDQGEGLSSPAPVISSRQLPSRKGQMLLYSVTVPPGVERAYRQRADTCDLPRLTEHLDVWSSLEVYSSSDTFWYYPDNPFKYLLSVTSADANVMSP